MSKKLQHSTLLMIVRESRIDDECIARRSKQFGLTTMGLGTMIRNFEDDNQHLVPHDWDMLKKVDERRKLPGDINNLTTQANELGLSKSYLKRMMHRLASEEKEANKKDPFRIPINKGMSFLSRSLLT